MPKEMGSLVISSSSLVISSSSSAKALSVFANDEELMTNDSSCYLREHFRHLDGAGPQGGQEAADQGGKGAERRAPPQGLHRDLERREERHRELDPAHDHVEDRVGQPG